MLNRKNDNHTFRTGVIVAAAAFIALSFLAGGMIEISRDVGMLRWLRDVAVYPVSYTHLDVYKRQAHRPLRLSSHIRFHL